MGDREKERAWEMERKGGHGRWREREGMGDGEKERAWETERKRAWQMEIEVERDSKDRKIEGKRVNETG